MALRASCVMCDCNDLCSCELWNVPPPTHTAHSLLGVSCGRGFVIEFFLLLFTVLHYSKWQARKRLFQPVAMTAENEAINFFTSDDEDGGEGEGQGEEGEWC